MLIESDLGREYKQAAVRLAGGLLPASEAAALLSVSVADIRQLRQGRHLLAVPLPEGDWGYPARQFAPDGRVRAGLKDVLAEFGSDEDPWIILSFLVSPDPVSGKGVALDSLDDPGTTRALVELARTFWEQGAT